MFYFLCNHSDPFHLAIARYGGPGRLRSLIKQYRGQKIPDGEVSLLLQREHDSRIIGYLSEEATRLFPTTTPKRGQRRDRDMDQEGGEEKETLSPVLPSKRLRLSSGASNEDGSLMAPASQNPFAKPRQDGEQSPF